MSELAIKAENLGKAYSIGSSKSSELRHSIGNRIRSLVKPDAAKKEEFWALRDISFEIKQGEAIGIIGRNGAGKSTLLKLLSRITDPSTGRFEINGRVSSLLEVGTGFHPELSGRENIFLNGTILGMKRSEIRAKFDQIVEFSGVEKFIETPVKHYSSGMKVRLAFSVAAHLEPEILIVDEVLAVGDAEFQKKCLGKMDEVSKEGGRTVIFVSHNMGAVQNLCNTGILLENGMITSIDNINKVVTKYISSGSALANNDFSAIVERRGNREFLFQNMQFVVDNKTVDTVLCGSDLTIAFDYESILPENTPITISVGVFTMEGTFLFACRNDILNQEVVIDKKRKVYCKIPSFPLRGGSYTFNLLAKHKDIVLDHLKNVGQINVENGDFYGTGKIPAGSRSGVLINYQWKNSL